MLAPWVMDEVKTAKLNDKRLNARLADVLSLLAAHPNASIPAACGGRAEMVAAYRFCENEKTSFENVLSPHRDATRQRVAAQPVVVLAQDTTEIDTTRPDQQVMGAGPLDGSSRRGALLHALHAFTPDGTPLGTVHAAAWVREEEPVDSRMSPAQQAARPIEEKESYRWVAMLRQASEEARHCPKTQLICVADSEADIYEVLVEGTSQPGHSEWIVRACQDRALLRESGENVEESHVRQHVLAQPILFRKTIHIRGRKAKVACSTRGRTQPRQSREAEVVARAARVMLRPPWRPDRKLPPVTVNVVLVSEWNPPPGEAPVEWFLLTSLPIDTLEQVQQIIQYYCVRWMIEILFRVLKSGCRVEERLFEYMDRLLTCVALYLIVAWRTLYVCRLGAVARRSVAKRSLSPPSGNRFGRWCIVKIRPSRRRRWASSSGWWRSSAATSTANVTIRLGPKRCGLDFNVCMISPPAGNFLARRPKKHP